MRISFVGAVMSAQSFKYTVVFTCRIACPLTMLMSVTAVYMKTHAAGNSLLGNGTYVMCMWFVAACGPLLFGTIPLAMGNQKKCMTDYLKTQCFLYIEWIIYSLWI